MIAGNVAGLQENELQTIIWEHEKSRKENERLKQENEALNLVIEQLTTQLDDKIKLLVTKVEEAQQLRRELQDCEAGRVHVKPQQAEFSAYSGLDSVSILYLLLNCN